MITLIYDNFLTKEKCLELKNTHNPNQPIFRDTYPMPINLNNTLLDKINKVSLGLANSIVDWAQIVYWPTNSYQKLHYDTASPETTLSSICYLNYSFTGGQTYFDEGTIFSVKTGRIIFFDGNYFLHGVKKIESGDRYTLAIWYKKAS